MHGLGGPEWAGALGAQRSASAALEAWLGLPTVPRSCARVGLKCTCKPGDHHRLTGAADRQRSAVLHRL